MPANIIVGFWGEDFAFTHQAATKLFPNNELKGFMTHKEMYKNLESDKISHAILPIHNSTAGTVSRTLDIITNISDLSHVSIVDEIYIQIHHCLYSKKKISVSDVCKYYTIEIAKDQCSLWLDKNLLKASFESVAHNSLAAKMLDSSNEQENIAAIGPKLLAEKKGFHIIEEHIEDDIHNTTRFIVLSKTKKSLSFNEINQCKATFAVILNDKPGALASVVKIITDMGFDIKHLKMTPIVSKGIDAWKDWFIFDLGIEVNSKQSINQLEKHLSESTQYSILLGVYPDRLRELNNRANAILGDIENNKNKTKSKNTETGQLFEFEKIGSLSESDILEYKSSFRYDHNTRQVNRDLELSVIKTICAFLNSKGGDLLIGVNDNGEIVGIERDIETVKGRNTDGFERALIDSINREIGPSVAGYINVYFKEIGSANICQVHVIPFGENAFVGRDKEYYIRFGCTTRNLNPKEASEYMNNKLRRPKSDG